MKSFDTSEHSREGASASPVLSDVHKKSAQQADNTVFNAERSTANNGSAMSPSTIRELLQSYNPAPAETDDRFLQASDLVTSTYRENPEDATMRGMGDSQVMQADTSGFADLFGSGNNQAETESDVSVPGPNAGDVFATITSVNTDTTPSQVNSSAIIVDGIAIPVPERSMQAPRIVSANDRAVLNDYQRGRLAKYRPSNDDWPVKNRSASVPPRCVDHYTFIANWPPQEPPRCDLGRRVDVFPPRDAPLHLHLQAYALRWGYWTSEIKDLAVRRQILDVVADKMKEAWENAIGENYYVRPVRPVDDSDHRNDAEEKVRRGRKRAVSPSKQPAGFASEGKDILAVTNGELTENGLTMEMINTRVREKDFDAGEQILDEVLDNLCRDQLTVKDWSSYGIQGSVRDRNLLMYSLYIVLECRNERRKLNNLLAKFSKESQRKNTRARIEMNQEREFQHMALASELEIARREALTESLIDEEDQNNDDEMKAETSDVTTQAENSERKKQDDFSAMPLDVHPASDEPASGETTSNDHGLIIQIAKIVLSANPDTMYTIFSEQGVQSTSFEEGGLKTGDEPHFEAAKKILGELLGVATRLVSLKEMVKREDDPREAIKINYDARLANQRILQAQQKLAKTLNLEFTGGAAATTVPGSTPVPPETDQSQSTLR